MAFLEYFLFKFGFFMQNSSKNINNELYNQATGKTKITDNIFPWFDRLETWFYAL